MARLVRDKQIDLSHVVIAMMDDYVEDRGNPGFVPVDESLPHSCRRFGRDEIIRPLNDAAGPGRRIPEPHLWMPDAADPAAYDEQLAAAGGIDCFLLASGASDGHVAFNPPGTPADTRTRVVTLADSTRRDNLVTFPTLGSLDRVPTHGVTVGIATITRLSQRAVLIATGPDKQHAVSRLLAADHYEPDWPATVLADCSSPDLYVDRAALDGAYAVGGLNRTN